MSDLVKADLRPDVAPLIEGASLPLGQPHDDPDPTPPADLPLDDGKAENARLRQEAEAEEAAAAAAAAGTPPQPAPVAPAAASEPAPAPAADPAQIMVPKARLDEALMRARNAEAGLLRQEGMIQAMQRGAPAAPAQPSQPAAPTLEQLIQAEETRIEEAATRFDAGEITMVEFQRAQRDAGAKIQSLREQALFEAVMARVPQQGMADEIIEARHLTALRKAHPWVTVIEADEGRLQVLADLARVTLAAEGQPITDGPAESLRLREKIAALSDIYGPQWYPTHRPPASAPAAPPRAPAPAPAPVARPAAPAAPAANPLARVASHPPNINEMGSTALASNDPTEEQIEAMSTDEIQALPASVKARLRQ